MCVDFVLIFEAMFVIVAAGVAFQAIGYVLVVGEGCHYCSFRQQHNAKHIRVSIMFAGRGSWRGALAA